MVKHKKRQSLTLDQNDRVGAVATRDGNEVADAASTELDQANRVISDLRIQNASQLAKAARKDTIDAHSRLLQTLAMPSGALAEHFPVADVFARFAGASSNVDVCEPYLVLEWPLQNLSDWLSALLAKTHVTSIRLSTHSRLSGNDGSCTWQRSLLLHQCPYRWLSFRISTCWR